VTAELLSRLIGSRFVRPSFCPKFGARFQQFIANKEFRKMTARNMTLRPAGSERKRRGRPSKAEAAAEAQARQAVALLAGLDTLTVSSQGRVSAEVYSKLYEAKEAAKHAEHSGSAHCPEWLSAQVKPKGDRGGGYPFLIETEDFTIKVAGEAQTMWPGLVIELRSHFLHAHPSGARGAAEEALSWTREMLLYDARQSDRHATTFEQVSVSRVDLHIDWQGGFIPSYSAGEERRFIRPRRTLWHPFNEGNTCLGYRFGSGKPLMARLYNKTAERKKRHDESYGTLLQEHSSALGIPYESDLDVWRLEFELHREALTSLKLAPESDAEDTETDIEAELSAEELPHVGTLPKLFAHLDAIFQHLSYHWLRLVTPSATQVRARWSLDSTWALLRTEFARLSSAPPLTPDALAVVRGARYRGRARLLRKMANGLLNSLEVEDTSVASASLTAIQLQASKWEDAMRRRAEKEAQRLAARRARLLARLEMAEGLDQVAEDKLRARLAAIEEGRGVADEQVERVRHRLQTLLGVFDAYGVTAQQVKPVVSVADLFQQHLDALEAEAEEKGGIAQLLRDHFQKLYKVSVPLAQFHAD
jgi:hypothetical protein